MAILLDHNSYFKLYTSGIGEQDWTNLQRYVVTMTWPQFLFQTVFLIADLKLLCLRYKKHLEFHAVLDKTMKTEIGSYVEASCLFVNTYGSYDTNKKVGCFVNSAYHSVTKTYCLDLC